MTVAFNVYFQHYFPLAYKAILRSTLTVFNATGATGNNNNNNSNLYYLHLFLQLALHYREVQIISLLWEVTQTRKVCHENVIMFQCIQIGKLELAKILI